MNETNLYTDDKTCLMGSKEVPRGALLHEGGTTCVSQGLFQKIGAVLGHILLHDVDSKEQRTFSG